MPPRAIETTYKGYKFRSRLEARWAVFFDELGYTWSYEPEGFDLGDGIYYLPDFRIWGTDTNGDKFDFWVEVKPCIENISDEDWKKMKAFASFPSVELLLLDGVPSFKTYSSIFSGIHGVVHYLMWSLRKRPWWEYFPTLDEDGLFSALQRGYHGGDCAVQNDFEPMRDLERAINASRSARFEGFSRGAK